MHERVPARQRLLRAAVPTPIFFFQRCLCSDTLSSQNSTTLNGIPGVRSLPKIGFGAKSLSKKSRGRAALL